MIQALVRAELAADGLEVISALNGLVGIDKATSEQPDLILLDVAMPGMSGHEVCEVLQVQQETAHIPVIFLSGASTPQDRVRGLEQGATDYIAKPFSGEELRARVRVSMRYRALLDMQAKRAMRDGMTGLWNRLYLDERLKGESAAAIRHGRAMSAIMADIDHFKTINDTHGHLFGDDVIRRVADVITHTVRRDDVACRYGGEEFLVLCPEVAASGAAVLAERIRQEVEAIQFHTGLRVTISLGVAQFQDSGDRLLKAADSALYQAKRGGRNRVCSCSNALAA
jgi:diguanylate cyclase (GGDEF)-like protein